VRAIRGATTLAKDTKEEVLLRTAELLRVMMERNRLDADDLISVFFTATEDVSSEFPAAAAREIGLSQVPLLCAREIPVEGSVRLCVRVLAHCYASADARQARHVYLRGARRLRTDLGS
jgi:chorismate mutase